MKPFSDKVALILLMSIQSIWAAPTAHEEATDLLRFANNDTLHGNLHSFKPKGIIQWGNPEAHQAIEFSISQLHRVVITRGTAHQSLNYPAHVTLINGDLIPATILLANSHSVEIASDHLGRLNKQSQAINTRLQGNYSCLNLSNIGSATVEIRISDMVIANWNGMRDSANSMKSTTRDVILMNNGSDHFSGAFKELHNGKVSFEGAFDNSMTIPIEELSELHQARQKGKQEQSAKELVGALQSVYFHTYPRGRVSAYPNQTIAGKIQLKHRLLGEISLNSQYLNMIDPSQQNNLLDSWGDHL